MYDQRSGFEPILEEHSSENWQAKNRQKNQKNPFISESRFPQYLISPAINPSDIKLLQIQSPSPLKKPVFNLMEQEQFHYQRNGGEGMMKNHNFISNLLNFNESPAPRKKTIEVGTAVRTPQNKKESKKSSKGLRTLSESVYEIVLELKVTTYKEVANRLVQNLNESGIRREDHYRDEQNIKRRVYDALNVLISASVLQKKGKEVMTDNTAIPQKMRVRENLMQRQYINKLENQLQHKKFIINQKRGRMEQLYRRYEVLETILKRNKKKKFNNKPKINFPLLGIVHEQQKESEQEESQKDQFENYEKEDMSIDKEKQEFKMKVQKLDNLIGDADLLMKIDIASHNIDEIMEAEVYDEEMQEAIQCQKKKQKKK